MSKTSFGVSVLAAVIEGLIAIGLLAITYGDTFGLAQIAANGEKILGQLAQLDQQGGSQSAINYMRPVLAASNQAFHQLSDLLSWVGVVLLICVSGQIAGLLSVKREK